MLHSQQQNSCLLSFCMKRDFKSFMRNVITDNPAKNSFQGGNWLKENQYEIIDHI